MKVLKWLDEHLEEMLLIILLVVLTGIMSVQVFMRKILNNSLTWSEELVRYMFVWSTFISVSYCIRKDATIRIDQAVELLPKNSLIKKIVIISVKVIMLAFVAFAFYFSIDIVKGALASGQKSSAMRLPMWLVQLSVPFGMGLAVIRMIQSLRLGSGSFVTTTETEAEQLAREAMSDIGSEELQAVGNQTEDLVEEAPNEN